MLLLKELPSTESLFYDEDFHRMLVKHFPYFIENNLFEPRDISGSTAEIYKGDFYGVLLNLGIPFEFHRINTEFNMLSSPLDYKGEAGPIRIIVSKELNRLNNIYKTRT